MYKTHYKELSKKKLVKMNKNQRKTIRRLIRQESELTQTIMQLKQCNSMLRNKLEASQVISNINDTALESCENANNMLHNKLDSYRDVIKDVS